MGPSLPVVHLPYTILQNVTIGNILLPPAAALLQLRGRGRQRHGVPARAQRVQRGQGEARARQCAACSCAHCV